MPLFKCSNPECGVVENTALCRYWMARHGDPSSPPLCSQCDPEIGKWHGVFERKPASGYKLGSDGFLYTVEDVESGRLSHRMEHQGFTIVGDA